MTDKLVLKEIPIQSSQLEDVKEYIQLLQTLDADQKRSRYGDVPVSFFRIVWVRLEGFL